MIKPTSLYLSDSGEDIVTIIETEDFIEEGDPYLVWPSRLGEMELHVVGVTDGPIKYSKDQQSFTITDISKPTRILYKNPRLDKQVWIDINIIPTHKYTPMETGGPAVGMYDFYDERKNDNI